MIDRLVAALERNRCVVHRVRPDDVGPLVTERACSLGAGDRRPLAWADHPTLTRLRVADALADAGVPLLRGDDPTWRARLPDAPVGLTGADLAAAEEGVLAIPGGPGAPRAVSLVPPAHLCVVEAGAVVERVADAVTLLARRRDRSPTVLVGGPSRTGDLEMRPTFGVHGPVRVEVVVVEPEA